MLIRTISFLVVLCACSLDSFAQFGNASRIQGRPVASTAPSDTNTICWDAALGRWKPCTAAGAATASSTTDNPSGTSCTTAGALVLYTTPTPAQLWYCPVAAGDWRYLLSTDPSTGTGSFSLTKGPAPTGADLPAVGDESIWISDVDSLPRLIDSLAVSRGLVPRSITGSWGDLKSTTVLTASTTDAACDTAPMTGTIYGWSARVSPANADATFKLWKNANATTDPTVADSINTAGIGITTGTRVSSTTLTDFTTLAVTIGDNICVNLSAVAGSPTYAAVKVLYR